MNVMSEFFYSDIWKDVQARVISTFALSGIGTVANAIPQAEVNNITQEVSNITQLIEIFTLVSYGMSILVAGTVLWRFVLWLKDRNKTKSRWHKH